MKMNAQLRARNLLHKLLSITIAYMMCLGCGDGSSATNIEDIGSHQGALSHDEITFADAFAFQEVRSGTIAKNTSNFQSIFDEMLAMSQWRKKHHANRFCVLLEVHVL